MADDSELDEEIRRAQRNIQIRQTIAFQIVPLLALVIVLGTFAVMGVVGTQMGGVSFLAGAAVIAWRVARLVRLFSR